MCWLTLTIYTRCITPSCTHVQHYQTTYPEIQHNRSTIWRCTGGLVNCRNVGSDLRKFVRGKEMCEECDPGKGFVPVLEGVVKRGRVV
jgi:hypothetical protein